MPDLRGLFLRGLGGESAALGQAQIDTMRPIVGSVSPRLAMYWSSTGAITVSGGSVDSSGTSAGGGHNAGERRIWNLDSSLLGPHFAGNETRPVNVAVRYLMRAAK